MKNLLLTIVFFGILFSIPKYAEAQRRDTQRRDIHRNSSELQVRMNDNSMFFVIFDRRKYDNPTSLFTLSNISPGNHRIIIKKWNRRHGHASIIYSGNINIPARSIVKARINRYNRLVINRTVPIDGGDYIDPGYYRKPNLEMSRLRHSIKQASFDSDKQRIAEQAISMHRVSSNQIYQILMMFSFESSKIKLAKFAYKHCVDKRNYYIVNDAFTFSSSIRELDNYIGSCKSDYYDDDWDHYNRDYYNNSNKW